MFVANATLANSAHDTEWQFYFMACLFGYGTLSPVYRVAELCFKSLLTMAVEAGKIPRGMARHLSWMLERRMGGGRVGELSYSGLRMKLEGAGREEVGTVEELAKRFEATVVVEAGKEEGGGDEDGNAADVVFGEFIDLERV